MFVSSFVIGSIRSRDHKARVSLHERWRLNHRTAFYVS